MWLTLGLICAFATSLQDILVKRATKSVDMFITMWAWWAFALPWLYVLLWVWGVPEIKPGFWLTVSLESVLLSFAIYYYVRGLEAGELSLSLPMLSFTPMLLLVTSRVILGESASLQGMVGVICVVVGSYVLNFKDRKKGFLVPFKSLVDHPGPRYMLIVAVLYSVGANLDKINATRSSPHFSFLCIATVITIILGVLMVVKARGKILSETKQNWRAFSVIGLLNSVSNIVQLTGVLLTIVPYLIAVKRMSVLFSSMYGFFVLKERGLKERAFGILLMIMGVFLIVFSK